jgi:hypothetical protein
MIDLFTVEGAYVSCICWNRCGHECPAPQGTCCSLTFSTLYNGYVWTLFYLWWSKCISGLCCTCDGACVCVWTLLYLWWGIDVFGLCRTCDGACVCLDSVVSVMGYTRRCVWTLLYMWWDMDGSRHCCTIDRVRLCQDSEYLWGSMTVSVVWTLCTCDGAWVCLDSGWDQLGNWAAWKVGLPT